jgi:hypothetical protein
MDTDVVDRPAMGDFVDILRGAGTDIRSDIGADVGPDIGPETEPDLTDILQDIGTDIVSSNPPWQVIEGDGIAALATIAPGSVGLILADLPYGTTPCGCDVPRDLEALWPAYWRVLRPGGAVMLTAVQPYTATLILSQPKRFKHEWIWQKNRSGSSFTARYRPLAMHESVLVFGRGRGPTIR